MTDLETTSEIGTQLLLEKEQVGVSEVDAFRHPIQQDVHSDAEQLLAAERARIARDLHDLVTHSVSVMMLQIAAAREIMRRDECRSRALLESVEESGRSALEELRRLLGLLSERDGDARRSQPGVSEIQALIEHVREAGVVVELRVEGHPRTISDGAGVAAYRIVQEALTNVLKHAGGALSRVSLRWSDAALELEIVDDGPSEDRPQPDAPAGRGLAGMRERARMNGGTFEAHRGADRGYVVRARIPVHTVAARAKLEGPTRPGSRIPRSPRGRGK